MVLHSYMLNPRSFLEDCIRMSKMPLWNAGFPFELVDQCIDNRTLVYFPGDESVRFFEQRTTFFWDNLLDSPDTLVECPRCTRPVRVPWTAGVVPAIDPSTGTTPSSALDRMFETFYGFADKGFRAKCPHCMLIIDHEKLMVAKFRRDVLALMAMKTPMPGTYFNLNGVPTVPGAFPELNRILFPNRFIQAIGPGLLSFTDPIKGKCESMNDLRNMISRYINNWDAIRKAKGAVTIPRLYPGERAAFRRMMSRYRDNDSPFAMDLVGAVIRQGTFVNKMDNIDWLHSPTLLETMGRLVKKYGIFFYIMAKHPGHMAVPTLDVDLAWHTHQLMPRRYYDYSTTTTAILSRNRIFVNHDDKVEELKLEEGFEWTAKQYTRETRGGIYSECTCWYCEAVRAPDLYTGPAFLRSSAVTTARENVATLHDRAPMSSDPDRNPHISTHNAIATSTDKIHKRDVRLVQLHNNFEKACRRMSKRKSSISGPSSSDQQKKMMSMDAEKGKVRDSSRNNDGAYPAYYMGTPLIWGYPLFLPGYAPFMCDPGVNNDAYPGCPACSSGATSGVGSCVAGTCAGAAGIGACSSGGGALAACSSAGCASGFGGGCAGAACGGGGGGGGGCGGGGC